MFAYLHFVLLPGCVFVLFVFLMLLMLLVLLVRAKSFFFLNKDFKTALISSFMLLLMSATRTIRMQHKWHESDTSETRATQLRRKCYTNDTSATRVKNFDFVMTRIKTYFHTLIFTIWLVKDYKERNNRIPRTTFWKCLFALPKCV